MNINSFPVYMVRSQEGKPCGHQHQTEEQAQNCAVNAATRERGRTFSVIRYDLLPDIGKRTVEDEFTSATPVDHFTKPLATVGEQA